MKKISFLVTILYLISFNNLVKAESNISLKEYLEKKDIEKGYKNIFSTGAVQYMHMLLLSS